MEPLFNTITSVPVVKLVQKGLATTDVHRFDQDFSAVHTELNAISQAGRQTLRQIHLEEVNETYGKYEEYIERQYAALHDMLEQVRGNPGGWQLYTEEFELAYEREKGELGLQVLYQGIIQDAVFGKLLLEVDLEHRGGSQGATEARCAHLVHLFHIGLTSLMAYTSVTEDDEDRIREKWAPRVVGIQAKMEDILQRCDGN